MFSLHKEVCVFSRRLFKPVSPLEIHCVQKILGHFYSVDFCCFSMICTIF